MVPIEWNRRYAPSGVPLHTYPNKRNVNGEMPSERA